MAVSPIPAGYHTVTPYLVLNDIREMVTFLEKAFDGKVKEKMETPDGTIMHAEVIVGDSPIMMGMAREEWQVSPAMLYLYVEDCDGVVARALAAGATSLQEPEDQFYGDRVGAVTGPSGHSWWIATRKEDLSHDELMARAASQGR